MFYSETFIDFYLTSTFTHSSLCVCHMSLKDLLTYWYLLLIPPTGLTCYDCKCT